MKPDLHPWAGDLSQLFVEVWLRLARGVYDRHAPARHPILRVVGLVEEGHSHRSAAAQFRVSIKFVNDVVILKRGPWATAAVMESSRS
jgi:hypothetical protein